MGRDVEIEMTRGAAANGTPQIIAAAGPTWAQGVVGVPDGITQLPARPRGGVDESGRVHGAGGRVMVWERVAVVDIEKVGGVEGL